MSESDNQNMSLESTFAEIMGLSASVTSLLRPFQTNAPVKTCEHISIDFNRLGKNDSEKVSLMRIFDVRVTLYFCIEFAGDAQGQRNRSFIGKRTHAHSESSFI